MSDFFYYGYVFGVGYCGFLTFITGVRLNLNLWQLSIASILTAILWPIATMHDYTMNCLDAEETDFKEILEEDFQENNNDN